VIELKLQDNEISRASGVTQLPGYMDASSVSEGWLIIFDGKSDKSWEEKISWETVTVENGKTDHILGC
jgi:hypothetical protein